MDLYCSALPHYFIWLTEGSRAPFIQVSIRGQHQESKHQLTTVATHSSMAFRGGYWEVISLNLPWTTTQPPVITGSSRLPKRQLVGSVTCKKFLLQGVEPAFKERCHAFLLAKLGSMEAQSFSHHI